MEQLLYTFGSAAVAPNNAERSSCSTLSVSFSVGNTIRSPQNDNLSQSGGVYQLTVDLLGPQPRSMMFKYLIFCRYRTICRIVEPHSRGHILAAISAGMPLFEMSNVDPKSLEWIPAEPQYTVRNACHVF